MFFWTFYLPEILKCFKFAQNYKQQTCSQGKCFLSTMISEWSRDTEDRCNDLVQWLNIQLCHYQEYILQPQTFED